MFNIFQKNKNSFFLLILLLIIFIIGLKIHSGYGIGGDEPTSRQNGAITINYLAEKLNTITNLSLFENDSELKLYRTPLNDYFDKDYGVVFDAPVFFIERLLKLETPDQFYNFRKIITFSVFILGLFSIFKISILYGNNFTLSIIAILLLLTSPRIFGESFYNSKDIVFMSAFLFATYNILKLYNTPTFKSVLFASLTSALATDIRIVAIILPVISVFFQLINLYKNKFTLTYFVYLNVCYVLLYVVFIILFWPWLWESPIDRFTEAFVNMSNFTRLIRWELFQGQFYPTTNLPHSYLLHWISITTPPIYLILFIIGFLVFLFKITKINSPSNINDRAIFDFVFLSIFTSFIILTIFKSPVLYNGWRHFYFIYPFFILICLNGIRFLLAIGRTLKPVKYVTILTLSITFFLNTYHIYRYYPLEYIYFNYFAGEDWNKKYPMDYSGLSGATGLKFILRYTDKDSIKISAIGPSLINLHKSLLLLNYEDKKRILLTDLIDQPDFVLMDYQSFDPYDITFRDYPVKGYEKIYDYMIKGKPVLSVFKKI